MIKRILTFILLLAPLCLAAETVSPDRAKKVAGNLLRSQGCRSLTLTQVAEPQYLTKSTFYDPAYYVFEGNDGGFVILAADDRVNPVIGWSAKGGYLPEDMPLNMRSWLGLWEDIIDGVRAGRVRPQMGAVEEWERVEKGQIPCYDSERQYETAKWGQDDPFNRFCPEFNGVISASGCVATATAILMRYHQWPEAGHGELPSYTYINDEGQERTVFGLTLGNVYDWENMPLTVDPETTDEQKDQIARLIADVGIMAQSSYYPSGTGAHPSTVSLGIVEHFYYDASAFNYMKEYFSDDVWLSMIYDNLNNVGPVLYSGYAPDGGHAFVVDGYNSKGEFSINWGWKGRGNGFFTFPAFDDYTAGHQALLNFKKDEGGKILEMMCIDGDETTPGLTSETTEFEVGVPFNVSCRWIYNLSARDFTGDFAVGVEHRDGTLSEILDQTEEPWEIKSFYGTSLYSEDIVITEPISIGDHLRLYFRSDNTPEWTPVPGNKELGIADIVPVADPLFLDEATSFKYTSASGELEVTTKKDAEWRLADADGKEYTDNIEFKDGVLTISTKKFPVGSYFLTLTKKDDSKTLEFVFGSK